MDTFILPSGSKSRSFFIIDPFIHCFGWSFDRFICFAIRIVARSPQVIVDPFTHHRPIARFMETAFLLLGNNKEMQMRGEGGAAGRLANRIALFLGSVSKALLMGQILAQKLEEQKVSPWVSVSPVSPGYRFVAAAPLIVSSLHRLIWERRLPPTLPHFGDIRVCCRCRPTQTGCGKLSAQLSKENYSWKWPSTMKFRPEFPS